MPEDHYPQTLPLVPEGIVVHTEEHGPVLLGGYCPACRATYFPRNKYCRRCLEPVEPCELSREGAIYSYTVVRIRPPQGLPQPYAVGYIDLADNGLRIFGLFDPAHTDRLAIGSAVRLNVGPLGTNSRGEPSLRPYFSLAKENDHG